MGRKMSTDEGPAHDGAVLDSDPAHRMLPDWDERHRKGDLARGLEQNALWQKRRSDVTHWQPTHFAVPAVSL